MEQEIKVMHHNDGKEKHQSHEIYSYDFSDHFGGFLIGYGRTKEEAYDEFTKKLDEFIAGVIAFRQGISANGTVKVDGSGNPIE